MHDEVNNVSFGDRNKIQKTEEFSVGYQVGFNTFIDDRSFTRRSSDPTNVVIERDPLFHGDVKFKALMEAVHNLQNKILDVRRDKIVSPVAEATQTLRKEADMSQDEFANKAGISRSRVWW